jgi:hypothetical protein
MKKITILVLIAALLLALVACGGADDTTAPPVDDGNTATEPSTSDGGDNGGEASGEPGGDDGGETGIPDGDAMAALISWMKDGTFSYDFTMTSKGPDGEMSASGSMAMDGDKMAMTQEFEMDGAVMTSRIVQKDDKTYIIDDANKMILVMAGANDEAMDGVVTDYTAMTKTGEGEGTVDGKTLPYEEYTQEGATVRYYMEDGEVYAIETESDGTTTVMVISNASSSVPSGAFDLPTGYAEMAM